MKCEVIIALFCDGGSFDLSYEYSYALPYLKKNYDILFWKFGLPRHHGCYSHDDQSIIMHSPTTTAVLVAAIPSAVAVCVY